MIWAISDRSDPFRGAAVLTGGHASSAAPWTLPKRRTDSSMRKAGIGGHGVRPAATALASIPGLGTSVTHSG